MGLCVHGGAWVIFWRSLLGKFPTVDSESFLQPVLPASVETSLFVLEVRVMYCNSKPSDKISSKVRDKNLESLKVCYDYTVRIADGSIIQFYYALNEKYSNIACMLGPIVGFISPVLHSYQRCLGALSGGDRTLDDFASP
nr:DNA-directed RNA polymerase I subunit 1 [Ipomoea batatas]